MHRDRSLAPSRFDLETCTARTIVFPNRSLNISPRVRHAVADLASQILRMGKNQRIVTLTNATEPLRARRAANRLPSSLATPSTFLKNSRCSFPTLVTTRVSVQVCCTNMRSHQDDSFQPRAQRSRALHSDETASEAPRYGYSVSLRAQHRVSPVKHPCYHILVVVLPLLPAIAITGILNSLR